MPAGNQYAGCLWRSALAVHVDRFAGRARPCRHACRRGSTFYGPLLWQQNADIIERCLEHPFKDWIKMYSSDEFKGLCTRLESLLNAVAEDCTPVRDAYRYALQCELDFFSAPLT